MGAGRDYAVSMFGQVTRTWQCLLKKPCHIFHPTN